MSIIKNWTIHNMISHPLSEIIYICSFGKAHKFSNWVHDVTVPKHQKGTGRG